MDILLFHLKDAKTMRQQVLVKTLYNVIKDPSSFLLIW